MFKSFDVYTKADSMVQQKTTTGALITLVSSIFMFFLFISEYGAYKEIRVADHMTIDPAYGEQIISVNLSMSFLQLKCKNVNIDIDTTNSDYFVLSFGQLVDKYDGRFQNRFRLILKFTY